jgi:hypothetical protein
MTVFSVPSLFSGEDAGGKGIEPAHIFNSGLKTEAISKGIFLVQKLA